MHVPFSDDTSNIVLLHLAKAHEHLTEVSNIAPMSSVQNYAEVGETSQLAFYLTLAAKQFAEGDKSAAQATLKTVFSNLSSIIQSWEERNK